MAKDEGEKDVDMRSSSASLKEIDDDEGASPPPNSRCAGSRGRNDVPNSANAAAKRTKTRSGSRRDMKRQRRNYRDEYRELLNEDITRAAHHNHPDSEDQSQNFPSSQVGLSRWYTQEKLDLFTGLERYGRGDWCKLSTLIGTKSSLEVQQYVGILQEGLREQHDQFRRETLLRYAEIPAAFEMSTETDRRLNKAAYALELFQHSHDEKIEKSRFGRFWKLTQSLAEELEEYATRVEESASSKDADCRANVAYDEPALTKIIAAATFFDVPEWLGLSERLFMNSVIQSQANDSDHSDNVTNWLGLTRSATETPSIFASALNDFYNIAVSVSKRVAIAANFQALSRLRATDVYKDSRARKLDVTKRDVRAAVDVLGLKRGSNDFWIGAARRNQVHVSSRKGRSDDPVAVRATLRKRLGYNEVERLLRMSNGDYKAARKNMSAQTTDDAELVSEAESSDSDRELFTIPDATRADDVAALHEDEADRLDQKASMEEEVRIWKEVLGQTAPASVLQHANAPTKAAKNDKRPPVQRKSSEEFKDWRDAVDFQAPWEQCGHVFDFERARQKLDKRAQKRRRLRRERVEGTKMSDQDEPRTTEAESEAESTTSVSDGSSEEIGVSDRSDDSSTDGDDHRSDFNSGSSDTASNASPSTSSHDASSAASRHIESASERISGNSSSQEKSVSGTGSVIIRHSRDTTPSSTSASSLAASPSSTIL